MSKISENYKFSIIQLQDKTSRQVTNIGIILYLNDKHTEYKIHLPRDSYTIITHSTLAGEQIDEVDNFYKLPKEKRNINNFPPFFHITKPEFFTSSRYLHSTADGLFKELKNTFITLEDLLIEEAELTDIYPENILLKFTIDTKLVDSQDMEYPGHSNLQVSIQYPYISELTDEEYIEELGYLNFALLNTEYDSAFDLLDYSDTTEHFIHLFDDDDNLLQCYRDLLEGYYGPFIDTYDIHPVILTNAFIFEKYRGNKLLKDVYKKVIKLLKLENSNSIVLFKAFAKESEKTEKLKRYYEEVGFLTLEHYMDGYIMCHPTSYVLVSDIGGRNND